MANAPLPLQEKAWQCHNCNMRVFWSFAQDAYLHDVTRQASCEGDSRRVAHPRIR